MKKVILLLCMAAGLVSCAKEILDTEKNNTPNEGVPMTFNVTVLETKAAKTDWADGDKIYVFFNGLETKYLILEHSDGFWNNTSGGGTLLSTDFEGLGTKTLTAVHFPVAVDVNYTDSKFSFTSGGKPVYNYYLFETDKTYTVNGTTVTATLALGKPADMVQIHVAGIQADVADYTFGCSKIMPVACASVGTDGSVTENVLQAGARLSGVADTDGGIFAGRLTSPGAAVNYKFTLASDANIYTLSRDSKTLTAGKMYNFPSLSTTGGSNWTVTAASDLYVDLGLSVKWAKFNVGATTETGNGDYFAWGEVIGFNEGKTSFYWSTYAWGTSALAMTKYCDTDGLTTLLPEDDAAYVALGGKFRMPTKAEFDELLNLSKEWVANYNETGISGYKFTGNGNTLFLPAARHKGDANLNDASYGRYWSSSRHTSTLYFAEDLRFSSGDAGMGQNDRYNGFSIRPVFK